MNDITKEDFEDYEMVRQSGSTNMFDTRTVSMLSGLERHKVKEILKRYDELCERYHGVRND